MTTPEALKTDSPSGVTWSSVLSGKSPPSKTKASPATVINGTVHITIPKEVLQESTPLWKTYVVGHFIGDSAPHIGKVHATVNRLWVGPDSKARIDANFINPKTVLFKIESELARLRVLRRQFWHISDIPMVVREWSPSTAASEPDLTAIPLWVDFAKVPAHLFSRRGLMFLGDSIGVAQRLHPNTEKCTRFDVARVLVEVNLTSELPERICLGSAKEVVDITYPWLPPRCSTCNKWGHQVAECSQLTRSPCTKESAHPNETEQSIVAQNIPVLTKNSSPKNQVKEIGKGQKVHQESDAEALGVHQDLQSEQVSECPNLGTEVHEQQPNSSQVHEQIPNDEMQVQIITKDFNSPKLTSGSKAIDSEQQKNSPLEKQRSDKESEEGEILIESKPPAETDDEEDSLQDQKVKQGGGYRLRNPPKEPITNRKESKRASRKTPNIKSSSRKA